MQIEEKIQNCEYNLKQINHFNPDPYYVNYFLKDFIKSIIDVYDGIIKEADRDFGLFISEKSSLQNFKQKAKEKNDKSALAFSTWFNENYENEHKSPYPSFVKKLITLFLEENKLPKIVVKILAKERYENDIFQEIIVSSDKGKLRPEELEIEIKRHIPLFLQLLNQKRKSNDEPKVSEKNVIASTFLQIANFETMEIPYSCRIYVPVLKRIVKDSRYQIKQLSKGVI
jgi:hypothetical protein